MNTYFYRGRLRDDGQQTDFSGMVTAIDGVEAYRKIEIIRDKEGINYAIDDLKIVDDMNEKPMLIKNIKDLSPKTVLDKEV